MAYLDPTAQKLISHSINPRYRQAAWKAVRRDPSEPDSHAASRPAPSRQGPTPGHPQGLGKGDLEPARKLCRPGVTFLVSTDSR